MSTRDPSNPEHGLCGPLVSPEIRLSGSGPMGLDDWLIGDPFTLTEAEFALEVRLPAHGEVFRQTVAE